MNRPTPELMAVDSYVYGDTWHHWSCDSAGTVVKGQSSRMNLRLDEAGIRLTNDLLDSPHLGLCQWIHLQREQLNWLMKVLPRVADKIAEQERDKAKLDLRQLLRERICASGKSCEQIEREAEVPECSVAHFLDGVGSPTPRWLQTVAAVVDFWKFT